MEIISQSELRERINNKKSKQYISQLATKRIPPFDVQIINGRTFIQLTDRTNIWIKNNQ